MKSKKNQLQPAGGGGGEREGTNVLRAPKMLYGFKVITSLQLSS